MVELIGRDQSGVQHVPVRNTSCGFQVVVTWRRRALTMQTDVAMTKMMVMMMLEFE